MQGTQLVLRLGDLPTEERHIAPQWSFPKLVVIAGGRGQLPERSIVDAHRERVRRILRERHHAS